MPRSERLYHLSCCAALLKVRAYHSLTDVQAAVPEQLREDLGQWHADLVRLIGEAHPDVLQALFPPTGIAWDACGVRIRSRAVGS